MTLPMLISVHKKVVQNITKTQNAFEDIVLVHDHQSGARGSS